MILLFTIQKLNNNQKNFKQCIFKTIGKSYNFSLSLGAKEILKYYQAYDMIILITKASDT